MSSDSSLTGSPSSADTAGPAIDPDERRRLRAIFDNAFGFIGLIAPDGTLLELNRRALDFAGVEHGDVTGRPVWQGPWFATADPERDRMREFVARAATGEFVRTVIEITSGSGEKSTLDLTLTPVRDARNVVRWIVGEGRDVTEARRAEHELRLSEAKFSGIVGISSDAIISTDEEHRIVLFNNGAETIFGWSAEEVIGKPLDVLIPERFRTAHREHVQRFRESPVAARRMGERREIAGLRRDGAEFPADASISKIDVDGATIFTVVLRDTTERRRAERGQRFLARAGQQLAASLDVETTLAATAELAVEFLADCCVIYDAGATGVIRRLEIRHGDAHFRSLMDELRNAPLDPNTPHPAQAVLETCVAELIPDVSDEYIDRHDPRPATRLFREIGVRSAMLAPLVARDRTIGVVAFYSSRPGRRYDEDDLALARELASRAALAFDNARLYREARNAVQARDDVLAVVSHDLGNPLSAIRIGTTLLLKNVPPEERGKGGWLHLEGIRNSAEQMERLVNDLLEIKRVEAGQLALDHARHTAANLIDETIELFAPIAIERGVELDTRVRNPHATLRCDRTRMLQVFSNLVGNALKFTPEGGRVEIGADATAAEVLFYVSDTGRGIAREDLPHVFDRFWRAQRAKREGIGLGLAIAKGIVQAHGGRIWADSTPGVGSIFHFALPLDAEGVDPTGN